MKRAALMGMALMTGYLSASGQQMSGSGIVTDQIGTVVPNAEIAITSTPYPNLLMQYTTDSSGTYHYDFDLNAASTSIAEAESDQSVTMINNGGCDHWLIMDRGHGAVSIYDLTGRIIGLLIPTRSGSGQCQVYWNGSDRGGSRASLGNYVFCSEDGLVKGKIPHNPQGRSAGWADARTDAAFKMQPTFSTILDDRAVAATDFNVSVSPSESSLQFVPTDELFALDSGFNAPMTHVVQMLGSLPGIRFTVTDTGGTPVADAAVDVFSTELRWRHDSAAIAPTLFTDANGEAIIMDLLPQQYWFRVQKAGMNNGFTTYATGSPISNGAVTEMDVTIRPLTANEILLTGAECNKVWSTTGIILITGDTMAYPVDSRLECDGTWNDSNGRRGIWYFNADETLLTYDYDADPGQTPLVIQATVIELTEFFFKADMLFQGLPVTYLMEAYYE